MDDNFQDGQEWPPKYTTVEQESIDLVESLPDTEKESENEKCIYDRKLWNYFQSCALSIAQLYRDNVNMQNNVWNSFQQASTNVACLYKECSEFQKKMYDGSHQNGYHKRTKELLTWAKKKKSIIRREELMAFLSGRPYPSTHVHGNYYHRYSRNSRSSRTSDDIQRLLNSSSPSSRTNSRYIYNDAIAESNNIGSNPFDNSLDNDETNLDTFRQAIARNTSNLISATNRRSPRNNLDEIELCEFINQEYHRHVESRKRTASMDVCMDSPTHNNKRAKYL